MSGGQLALWADPTPVRSWAEPEAQRIAQEGHERCKTEGEWIRLRMRYPDREGPQGGAGTSCLIVWPDEALARAYVAAVCGTVVKIQRPRAVHKRTGKPIW